MEVYTLFEKVVRSYLSGISVNRAPTENELRNACNAVRLILPAITEDEAEKIIKHLQTALDVAMDVGEVLENEYEPWLMARKKSIDFYYWNRYALYLEQDQHRAPGVVAAIDHVSDRIVDLAGDPKTGSYLHRRGLLIGDVQSGKTANYIAVMNKAADVGYKVIILLTGTVESLRRQTQERVDEGFIGRSSKAYLQRNSQTIKKGVGSIDSRRFATGFTTEASDFKTAVVRNMNASLHNMSNEPVVFVLKKNARTMQNLIDWLENYNANNQGRIDLPLLLIDDEADNASINTKTENEPAAINKLIRKLLSLFLESSYIAVTATPFANIFILPDKTEEMENDDLFPSDYIYALDAPTNYIGGNEIFGNDASFSSALIAINDAEDYFPYKHKQDIYIPELPNSLYDALRYFILANAARDIRNIGNPHRSMLVNVSRFVKVQESITHLISEWLYEVQRDIRNYCMLDEEEACRNDIIAQLRDDWNNKEYPFAKFGMPWEFVQKECLLKAASAIEVRTINQRSATKLDYTEYGENGLRVIAVGGLSLSRGLTLEGLMVSYFHRNTQMYDTLMQMGRWFGYRTEYEDLFRIWMPDDASGWYAHITSASNELREDIAKMNRLGATPKEFGLKVRAHPTSLIVTARNKMKHADRVQCLITLDGFFFETPRFKPDINIIRSNKQRSDALVHRLINTCGQPVKSGNQPLFWHDVPCELVCDYVIAYENHPLNMETDGPVLRDYIQANPNFAFWDILIPTSREETILTIDGLEIHPFNRPVLKRNNILSIYGTKMRIGTIGLTRHGLTDSAQKRIEDEYRESKRTKYEQKYGSEATEKLRKMSIPDKAYLVPNKNPILIIHYIAPNEKSDLPIGFEIGKDYMVGYGIGFPALAGSTPVYAIYYINMVEQKQNFEDEIEEDQFDDNIE